MMNSSHPFAGFPREGVQFLIDLRRNNDRTWFEANKHHYEEFLVNPAREFVTAMGQRLSAVAPEIQAIPQIDRSIFRIYRDVRFSKDKTPYKTHLGIWMWEGPGKKLENSGFYFQIDPPKFMIASGIHIFPKHFLKVYRDAVVDPQWNKALHESIEQIGQYPELNIGNQHYKRVPRGYDPEHPDGDLLRFNGLTVGMEEPIPEMIYSSEIIDYCYTWYQRMLPLHRWLLDLSKWEKGEL